MNNWINKVYTGDCRETMRQMIADGVKVQTCVTSPPYWGLRDYGTAKWEGGSVECDHNSLLESQLKPGSTSQTPVSQAAGTRARQNGERLVCRKCGAKRIDAQLGLEKSPELYVQNMVEVFRLVRELLADDGTLWLNLGDSYNGSGGAGGDYNSGGLKEGQPKYAGRNVTSLKPKDLVGIPWRVAFALQADGWWLRQDIIWAKPNPMPESVTDRCTKSHEYIFLLSKSQKYFYDADAIAEPFADERMGNPGKYEWRYGDGAHGNRQGIGKEEWNKDGSKTGRNKRSVWTVATKPYSEAHFATFPPALIEPCILAGTSEKGECPECGKAWIRMVKKTRTFESGSGKSGRDPVGKNGPKLQGGGETGDIRRGPCVSSETTGWKNQCLCGKYTCNTCSVVIEYKKNIKEVYHNGKRLDKESEGDSLLSILQKRIYSSGVESEGQGVLREDLCGKMDDSKQGGYGENENDKGIYPYIKERSSDVCEERLCDGASVNNGGTHRTDIASIGDSSPQKRHKVGQQDGELGTNVENDSRQNHSARKKISGEMSSMWSSFFHKRTCPICSGKIEFVRLSVFLKDSYEVVQTFIRLIK